MEKVVFPAGEVPSSQMSGYSLPPHHEALLIEMMTILLLSQHAPWFWQMPYYFGRKMEYLVTQMLGEGLNLNLLFLIKVKSFLFKPLYWTSLQYLYETSFLHQIPSQNV